MKTEFHGFQPVFFILFSNPSSNRGKQVSLITFSDRLSKFLMVVAAAWAFGLAFVVFYAGNAVVRFRVSEKAEIAGLNISELGLQHESELQTSTTLSRDSSG